MLPDYRADNPYQKLLVDELAVQGAAVEFPKGYRRGLPIFRAAMDSRNKPDILHLHWLTPYSKWSNAVSAFLYRIKMILDLWLTRLYGLRLVWTIHNLSPHETKWPRLDAWLRRRVLTISDRVIVHSHNAKTLVCEKYHSIHDKVVVIPHGHYRDYYGPRVETEKAREKRAWPKDKN